MRTVAVVLAGIVMMGGCSNFLVASGPAADRWAALEKSRAAKQLAASTPGQGQICKSMPVMGSNMPQRVCSTQEEWDEFDRQTRESVEAFDRDRKQGITQGAFE